MLVKQNYAARCLRVIDGDTILVYIQCPTCGDGKQIRIRLARVDAPENVAGSAGQWNAARQFLKGLVEGEEVVVILAQKWPDKYGRLVAEVTRKGANVSNDMLASGLVRLYLSRRTAANGRYTSGGTGSDLDDFEGRSSEGASIVQEGR